MAGIGGKIGRTRTALVLSALLAQIGAGSARGADWPQWGGSASRNPVSAEMGLPETFAPGKEIAGGRTVDMQTTRNVRWTAPLGTQTYGTPVVAGGRVFIGTNADVLREDPRFESLRARGKGNGVVLCLDEQSGRLLWKLPIPPCEHDVVKRTWLDPGLGVCSPATVEGDRLYVVSSRGELLCLDVHGMSNGNDGPFLEEERYWVKKGEPPVPPGPEDGDIIWRFDMVTELPSCANDAWCSAVLIHGDFLYVGTSNGVNGGHKKLIYPLAPSLIAVDKKTGRLAAVDDEQIGTRLFHGQWSSPALAEVKDGPLIIYGGGDGVCYAFEPIAEAGPEPAVLKKAWSFDCNPPEYKFRDGKPIDYFAGGRARPPADRRDPSEEAGQYVGPSEIIGTPVFYNNRVYVATGEDPTHGRGKGILNCIDATGSGDITQSGKVWSYTGLDRTMATAAIADGLLYLPDIAGRIHCLDADTGKPHWVHETKSEIWGPALVADGRLYVGTKRGLLIMAAGKEAQVLRQVPLGRVHCPPVAANRTLYVATGKTLWAAQAEGPPRTTTASDEAEVELGGK